MIQNLAVSGGVCKKDISWSSQDSSRYHPPRPLTVNAIAATQTRKSMRWTRDPERPGRIPTRSVGTRFTLVDTLRLIHPTRKPGHDE